MENSNKNAEQATQNENPTPKNEIFNHSAEDVKGATGLGRMEMEELCERMNEAVQNAGGKRSQVIEAIMKTGSRKELASMLVQQVEQQKLHDLLGGLMNGGIK